MKKKQQEQPRAMKKLYALTKKRPIDVSLSENPLGCSPLVGSAFKELDVDFNDYPPPNGKQLREQLSSKYSLDIDNFFVANGSESIINDLPSIFCKSGGEAVIPELTFPMFAVCSELAGLNVVFARMRRNLTIDLDEIRKYISERTKLIFICNPNNPTGSVLPRRKIIEFLQRLPNDVLVVVDEANIEFGGESVICDVKDFTNLIVLRTFSKGYGLATLRVGYAAANTSIIQKFEEETPIFQTCGISEQLACTALKDADFINRTRLVTSQERNKLQKQLQKLGFVVFPSNANNIFVQKPGLISDSLFIQRLAEKGVSVVAGSNFDGFDDSFFRVSIRDSRTNKRFIQKVEEIIEEST